MAKKIECGFASKSKVWVNGPQLEKLIDAKKLKKKGFKKVEGEYEDDSGDFVDVWEGKLADFKALQKLLGDKAKWVGPDEDAEDDESEESSKKGKGKKDKKPAKKGKSKAKDDDDSEDEDEDEDEESEDEEDEGDDESEDEDEADDSDEEDEDDEDEGDEEEPEPVMVQYSAKVKKDGTTAYIVMLDQGELDKEDRKTVKKLLEQADWKQSADNKNKWSTAKQTKLNKLADLLAPEYALQSAGGEESSKPAKKPIEKLPDGVVVWEHRSMKTKEGTPVNAFVAFHYPIAATKVFREMLLQEVTDPTTGSKAYVTKQADRWNNVLSGLAQSGIKASERSELELPDEEELSFDAPTVTRSGKATKPAAKVIEALYNAEQAFRSAESKYRDLQVEAEKVLNAEGIPLNKTGADWNPSLMLFTDKRRLAHDSWLVYDKPRAVAWAEANGFTDLIVTRKEVDLEQLKVLMDKETQVKEKIASWTNQVQVIDITSKTPEGQLRCPSCKAINAHQANCRECHSPLPVE